MNVVHTLASHCEALGPVPGAIHNGQIGTVEQVFFSELIYSANYYSIISP
jgi:hypothetical protein